MTDGKYVFAYFGTAGLACFDYDGNLMWKKDLGNWKMTNNWGTASSPVLYGDSVIVQNDNQDKSFLIALDKATGKDRVQRIMASACGSADATPCGKL